MPCQILAEGQYDVEYRLFVSCRNGCIYIVKSGVVQDQFIQVESKPVAMARVDKHLLIAGMDNTLQSYFLKGKKNWSIQMPSEIAAVNCMDANKND